MNMDNIIDKFISLFRDKYTKDITNIYSISPKNPCYPYLKISLNDVYNFSTFSSNLFRLHIVFERFELSSNMNFIELLIKMKDVVTENDVSLDSWEMLYKKFNKISLKQYEGVLHGSVYFEFLLKQI